MELENKLRVAVGKASESTSDSIPLLQPWVVKIKRAQLTAQKLLSDPCSSSVSKELQLKRLNTILNQRLFVMTKFKSLIAKHGNDVTVKTLFNDLKLSSTIDYSAALEFWQGFEHKLFVPFDVFIERLCLKFPVHSANIQDHERDIAHFVDSTKSGLVSLIGFIYFATWFRPFSSSIPQLLDCVTSRWFHPDFNSEEATKHLLEQDEVGCFLVR